MITSALAHMAAFRQADVSDMTLDLYSAQLTADQCDPRDVEVACERHGRCERAEGETAFPSLGQLRRLIDTVRSERAKREYEAEYGTRVARLTEHYPPVNPERQKVWMQRIRYTSKYGGTSEDAARLFPMPDERHV